jgi:UDP-glucose 4-epimerase
LANEVNVGGTLSVLEAARRASVGRTVLSSSNVVYAAHTPYRATKEMGEMWGRVYNELYGVSNVSLRYSNVYGPRQSERGPSPNVFAAFRKSHRENGYIAVTGDGTQTRQFTHVHDIVSALILAMASEYVGQPLDIVNETRWSMNEVVKIWGSTPKYLPERVGDVKHIVQSAEAANKVLGWEPTIGLCDGIKTCFECPEYMR